MHERGPAQPRVRHPHAPRDVGGPCRRRRGGRARRPAPPRGLRERSRPRGARRARLGGRVRLVRSSRSRSSSTVGGRARCEASANSGSTAASSSHHDRQCGHAARAPASMRKAAVPRPRRAARLRSIPRSRPTSTPSRRRAARKRRTDSVRASERRSSPPTSSAGAADEQAARRSPTNSARCQGRFVRAVGAVPGSHQRSPPGSGRTWTRPPPISAAISVSIRSGAGAAK